MSWIASLARVIGSAVPFGGVAVQISAELDSRQIQARLQRLEDPISALHPDVRAVSQLIYESISDTNRAKVVLDDAVMQQYARPIALLEGRGLIAGAHALGKQFADGFSVRSPEYILYMAALYEDPDLVERFVARVEGSAPGRWLNGVQLAEEYALPVPVVRAVFEFHTQKGLGLMSGEIGTANYLPQA